MTQATVLQGFAKGQQTGEDGGLSEQSVTVITEHEPAHEGSGVRNKKEDLVMKSQVAAVL